MSKQELMEVVYDEWTRAIPDVDAGWGLAICHHESNWNPKAVSPPTAMDARLGGAWGLCQLTYATAKDIGFLGYPGELLEPMINAHFFARLTSLNMRAVGKFPTRFVAAHNCGVGHVQKRTVPASTSEQYVPAVTALYEAHYKGWKPPVATCAPALPANPPEPPSETTPTPVPSTDTPKPQSRRSK